MDLRLTRLGEGGESAARAVHLAKAVVEDSWVFAFSTKLWVPKSCIIRFTRFFIYLYSWGYP